MRNAIIGLVVGGIVGLVLGANVLAPRLVALQPEVPQAKTAAAPPQEIPAALPAPERPAPEIDPSSATEADGEAVTLSSASAFNRALPLLGELSHRLERTLWNLSKGRLRLRFGEKTEPPEGTDLFDMVSKGNLDAVFSSPVLWGKKVPALKLFGAIPFGPQPDEYLAWLHFGGGAALYRAALAKHNIHGIVCGILPPEGAGWFRRPITKLEDLNGLKMAVSGLAARILATAGVQARDMDGAAILDGLRSGAIDAAEFSMPAVDMELGLHRLVQHYYLPGWHQPATLFDLMINRDRWKSLSETDRVRIETACGDNVRHALARGEAVQFPALIRMQAEGVVIHRWPPKILEALRLAWGNVAAEEAKADPDFRKVWRSLMAFRRDYAIWEELGHP